MNLPVVLAGCTGFIGAHLLQHLLLKGHPVLGFSRHALAFQHPLFRHHTIDLCRAQDLQQLRIPAGAIFINASGYASPDLCEINTEISYQQNVMAAAFFAQKAADTGALQLIHLSTDLIFGEGGPHSETDLPHPVNQYGRHKLLGEQQVRQLFLQNACIVRPVMLYGITSPFGKTGFVQMVLRKANAAEPLAMANDQVRNPTAIHDLCSFIERAIVDRFTGDFHLGGHEFVSPYEMTLQILKKAQMPTGLVRSVPSTALPVQMPRALRTGVVNAKAKSLGWMPQSMEDALQAILAHEGIIR